MITLITLYLSVSLSLGLWLVIRKAANRLLIRKVIKARIVELAGEERPA